MTVLAIGSWWWVIILHGNHFIINVENIPSCKLINNQSNFFPESIKILYLRASLIGQRLLIEVKLY